MKRFLHTAALWALLAAAALGGATVLTLLRRKHGQ